MSTGKLKALAWMVALLVSFVVSFVLAPHALAQPPSIEATLSATPPEVSGPRPVTVNFRGAIRVTDPQIKKVQYRIIRSDDAITPIETLAFPQPGSQEVSSTWMLGMDYQGWQAIEVLYPRRLESNKANFRARCGAGAAAAPATTLTMTPATAKVMAAAVGTAQASVKDCLSFSPQKAKVVNIGGSWKIVDGQQWLYDFGGNRAEAEQALAIIKRYRLDQQCFVGNPRSRSFSYLLTSGGAPSGSMPGEDCISFNPRKATLRNIDGRWTIVDGDHLLFEFGPDEAAAKEALAAIRQYQFNQTCFVGRPQPSFQYLKR